MIVTEPYQSPWPPAWQAFGERLRQARLARNQTLRDFAWEVGYRPVAISAVEQGDMRPGLDSVALAMCVALGIPYSDLNATPATTPVAKPQTL